MNPSKKYPDSLLQRAQTIPYRQCYGEAEQESQPLFAGIKWEDAMQKRTSMKCITLKRSLQICPHCAGADPDLVRRERILQLVALIEHPTALPAESALRIAQELLAWSGNCDRLEQGGAVEIELAAVA